MNVYLYINQNIVLYFLQTFKASGGDPFSNPLNPISLLGASEVATFPRSCGGYHHEDLGEAPFTIDLCVLRQCIAWVF